MRMMSALKGTSASRAIMLRVCTVFALSPM